MALPFAHGQGHRECGEYGKSWRHERIRRPMALYSLHASSVLVLLLHYYCLWHCRNAAGRDPCESASPTKACAPRTLGPGAAAAAAGGYCWRPLRSYCSAAVPCDWRPGGRAGQQQLPLWLFLLACPRRAKVRQAKAGTVTTARLNQLCCIGQYTNCPQRIRKSPLLPAPRSSTTPRACNTPCPASGVLQ